MTPRQKNRLALIVCAAMLAFTLALYFLPMNAPFHTVWTKTATNSVVGDEKYIETLAQVEERAAEYPDAQIVETVTETVSKKGDVTSKVTFEVRITRRLNAWQMVIMGFKSAWLLMAVLAMETLALLLSIATLNGFEKEHRRLPRWMNGLRTAAAWLCLAALVLGVIFPLCANLDFSRMPQKLNATGKAITKTERTIQTLVTNQEKIEATIRSLEEKTPGLQENVAACEAALAACEAETEAAAEAQKALDAARAALKSNTDSLAAKKTELTKNLADQEANTQILEGDRATLAANEGLMKKYHELFYRDDAYPENLSGWLNKVDNTLPWTYWFLPVVLFGALLGYVLLAKGELTPTLSRGALYLFVIVLCVAVLYPFFVMLITGFRSNQEAADMNFLHILPTDWHWENIPAIINRGVPQYLLNSILLSVGATAIAMLCGIPAAYAMARMNFKGKKAFLGFVIMSQMFSPVVLLVGIAQLMDTLKLTDSIVGLMLINAAFNQAFAIWLLRGTFVSISSEMEQAACIDGCNSVSALTRILLPMAAPGIVTTLIFVFINAWNEYTISTVLISTNMNKPITVGITQFSSYNMIEWNYLFAASLIATIPVVILFMCIEKHLVSGLTSGGVKG